MLFIVSAASSSKNALKYASKLDFATLSVRACSLNSISAKSVDPYSNVETLRLVPTLSIGTIITAVSAPFVYSILASNESVPVQVYVIVKSLSSTSSPNIVIGDAAGS